MSKVVDVWQHTHKHGSDVYLMFRDSGEAVHSTEQVVSEHRLDFEPYEVLTLVSAIEPNKLHADLLEWVRHYRKEIRPLREDADAGIGCYAAYDEAYNARLESLHELVEHHLINEGLLTRGKVID